MPTDEPKPPNRPPYAVGMDVHQKTISVAILDPDGQLVDRRTIKTSVQALDQLHRDLEVRAGGHPVLVGLEASTAGKWTFQHLRSLGLDVRMAHPLKLRALMGETKTDANDALMLATVLRLGTFPGVYVPPPEIESLRTLVRVRGEVVEKLKRCKIQVRNLLVKNNLQHEATKFDDIFGVQALRWLKTQVHLTDAWDQRQLSLLLEEGELFFRQQYDLTTELAKVAVDREDVRILQSIPGLDYTLALTIIAEVGDVRRFRNRKKFAAYCGLVPRNKQSGEVDAPHTRRRKGNSHLTWAFEIAVQGIRKAGRGRFHTLLKQLEKKLGGAKAVTAVAHRLAFTAYALLKKGQLYEESHANRFARKRHDMAVRAKKSVEVPTVPDLVDKLMARHRLQGVAT